MKLKQLRQMHGLSQADFAKQFGLSQNALSNYENGNRGVSPSLLKEISQKYNCPIDYLLDNDLIGDGRISEALISQRKEQGITLNELSEKTKIPLRDLKAYEKGDEPINLYLLDIICGFYGISVYDFYVENDMYDEYIPKPFNGDVVSYEEFKKAVDQDALSENTSRRVPILDEPEIRALARRALQNDPKKAKKFKKLIQSFLDDDEDDDF